MKLSQIIRTAIDAIKGPADEIAAICSDSRKVVPGALFVAVKAMPSTDMPISRRPSKKGPSPFANEVAEATWTERDVSMLRQFVGKAGTPWP